MSKKSVATIIGLSLTLGYFFGELKRIERVEQVSRVDKPLSSKNLLEQKIYNGWYGRIWTTAPE